MKPAQARKGRYFPIARSEAVALSREPASTVMANPSQHSASKVPLAELRAGRLTVFSLPDGIAPDRGTRLMHEVLALLLEAGTPKAAGLSGGIARMFVVYYEPLAHEAVTLYERRLHVQRRKFRSAQKFSGAFKPRINRTEEKRLASRSVADHG